MEERRGREGGREERDCDKMEGVGGREKDGDGREKDGDGGKMMEEETLRQIIR